MASWYRRGVYQLTTSGKYSITQSYLQPLEVYCLACHKKSVIKERVIVSDSNCCSCDLQTMETNHHLFGECNWIKSVREELMLWTNSQEQQGDMKHMLVEIKKKH
ncbi:hypothetical protein FXO37_27621 [Capsicum annuum]|nr:hypothetical protein FXO37_27621 [Capsicum annuum]